MDMERPRIQRNHVYREPTINYKWKVSAPNPAVMFKGQLDYKKQIVVQDLL